ncbi:MAG: insulinase family protein [Magnetococcales bacterium]|nr:insulinase family protein [Magnetococcales bacterium]
MSETLFVLQQREAVPTLNLTVESYQHRITGARHIHLSANDPHNAFLVALLTMPEDSTGVAHILEHTALCGSERYPVRDPFFMMLRRSLSTFMNAFTASDWTAYPFASQCRRDFANLLDVYLDAVFFPKLSQLDFSQEGWRLEFSEPDDPNTDLVFRGVVFNEMKGAMSSPVRLLSEVLGRHLFPTVTYRYNSGGDPEVIPNLTWEGLRAFHARHYHPSNAVFMTYGDITAAEHQAVFQQRVLDRFDRPHPDMPLSVPDEQRRTAPLQVVERYALDEADTTAKTHIVIAWLLDRNADLKTVLRAHLLSGVLLNNSSSPLLQALETSTLGRAPSPLCGLDDGSREMVFSCGLEGSEIEHADVVEALIMGVLQRIADEGVEPERLDAVLHQLELSRREVSGDGLPYGLELMMRAMPAAIHRSDPVAMLNLDPVLQQMHAEIKQPDFIQNLVRSWFLDNPHRVRLVLHPDRELTSERQQREQVRLQTIQSALDDEQQQRLVALAAALKQRQETEDDPEILPRVELSDIPTDLAIPTGTATTIGTLPATWYAQPTNGLAYQQLVLDLPALTPEQIDLLPLFASCLTEVGCGQRDYLAQQAWQSAICGGISAAATVRMAATDLEQFQATFTLSSKALVRNHGDMTALLHETLEQARFDELPRLRELIAQMRASTDLHITDNGHGLAMAMASSGMGTTAALSEHWSGITAIRRLRHLDQALNQPQPLQHFADTLVHLRDQIAAAPRQLLLVGEEEHWPRFSDQINQCWQPSTTLAPTATFTPFDWPAHKRQVRSGWHTVTQVHFSAKAYAAVPYTHDDAPALLVLGTFLKNGYLHRAIREQGGAYGSGAGIDLNSGVFRFFSYRDPRLSETLADFDRSLAWLQENKHEPRALEEAILGVISSIDRPGSPAGEAKRAFHDQLHGRTATVRRQFRRRVLEVGIADLRRVAERYLQPEQASIAVVSHAGTIEERERLGLENFQL